MIVYPYLQHGGVEAWLALSQPDKRAVRISVWHQPAKVLTLQSAAVYADICMLR